MKGKYRKGQLRKWKREGQFEHKKQLRTTDLKSDVGNFTINNNKI